MIQDPSKFQLVAYGFNHSNDIETISSDSSVSKEIDIRKKTYQAVNVRVAMTDLLEVDKLLQLAYAGSKGFKCAKQVVEIKIQYQSLINDSALASGEFVQNCLKALFYHKSALNLLAKGQSLSAAMKIIAKCNDLASTMTKQSEELVTKAKDLWKIAKEGLLAATNDETETTEKKKKIEVLSGELKAQEDSLKSMSEDLAKGVEEEREKEKELAAKADKAQRQAFILSLISTLAKPINLAEPIGKLTKGFVNLIKAEKVSPNKDEKDFDKTKQDKQKIDSDLLEIQKKLAVKRKHLEQERAKQNSDQQKIETLETEITELEVEEKSKNKTANDLETLFRELAKRLDKNADSYLDQQEEAAKRRVDFQNKQIQANADLAKTITQLKNMQGEKDDLNKAIVSLEIVVRTLGKVITAFENTRLFWKGVQNHCNSLTSDSLLECIIDSKETNEVFKDLFIETLTESALGWVALGKINLEAKKAIEGVKDRVDQTMNHLPTKEESVKLIDSFSLLSLEQEYNSVSNSNNNNLKLEQ